MTDEIIVRIKPPEHTYSVNIGRGLISKLDQYIPFGKRKTAVITDKGVPEEFWRPLVGRHDCEPFVIEKGEEHKQIETAVDLWKSMLRKGYNRDSQIVNIGGGKVTDIGGFIASTLNRGVPCYHVSTTLLGAVDAAIGGKTGVDLDEFKNKVGAFYQPDGVVVDLDTFSMLPKREMVNGLGEVIKYGIILDRDLFADLERGINTISDPTTLDYSFLEKVVKRCCELKAMVVSGDERDSSKRSILNYGHTIGHAEEGLREYEEPHGFCVAKGMVIAGTIAVKMGILPEQELQRHIRLITKAGLPVKIKQDPRLTIDTIIATANKGDKKAKGGRAKLVLVEDTGKIYMFNGTDFTGYVDTSILRDSIKENME